MSGFTLTDIVEAIADKLSANLSDDTNVYPYPVSGSRPSVTVLPDFGDFIDYFGTFGPAGIGVARFRLRIEPGGEEFPEAAVRRLYDFLSAGTGNGRSVMDALGAADVNGKTWTLGLDGCAVRFVGVDVPQESLTADVIIEVHINKIGAVA